MSDLVMPKLGLTMTEGLLAEWKVGPGHAFAAGDVLYVVETEKIANEIEAQEAGRIEVILVPEGETVPVGTPVARTAGAAAAARAPGRVVATPLARRMAAARGVDLATIQGSGPRGRIKAADIERMPAAEPPAPAPAAVSAQVAPAGAARATTARAATARRVAASKRDVPHFYVQTEAEVTALTALRAQLNADPRYPRITVSHLLLKAIGNTLAAMPEINRIWLDEAELALDATDVGLVADTPDGLRIPVVRDVAARPLDAVAAEARDKTARARDGRLVPADVGGGAISLSNVGMHDVTTLVPIISPPQSMILGVGAERGVFRPDAEGRPALCRELVLSLACDHRVIDGALAARFLAAVAAAIRTPLGLLRPAP